MVTTSKKISRKIIIAPAVGHVLDAPPVLKASDHSVDYTCGRCSAILLHAEEDQVQGGFSAVRSADRTMRQTAKPPQSAARLIHTRHCADLSR